MSNELVSKQSTAVAVMGDRELMDVLRSSLYPGAKDESIWMALQYCRAAGLDPLQKPVHIVPMWDSDRGGMRDVIMPGINLYRIQAARSGTFAGMSEPEFGPMIEEKIGGQNIAYPEWCRITIQRRLATGECAQFTVIEYWTENYAAKGGKERSIAPNAMWSKRPRGQLAKCASAQALRLAFPEIASAPTAEEMEGKTINDDARPLTTQQIAQAARPQATGGTDAERAALISELERIAEAGDMGALVKKFDDIGKDKRRMIGGPEWTRIKGLVPAAEAVEPPSAGPSYAQLMARIHGAKSADDLEQVRADCGHLPQDQQAEILAAIDAKEAGNG